MALADQAEIDAAIASAKAAFPAWSNLSLARRQAVLFKFRELLDARKGELAEIITSEHGKVLSDALGEISRGQEVVEFATGLAHHLKGEFSEQVSTGIDVYSTRQPLGVVGIIQPVQLPRHGASVVLPDRDRGRKHCRAQASEKDPSAAIWLARLWKEAGLPDGVFTVLNGDKEAVDGLLEHPDVAVHLFRRFDARVAKYVYETGTRHGKRVQALGGAKNHMLVLPDADLDLTADSGGQRWFRLGGRALHGHFGRRGRRAGCRRARR